jgi:class 3 adenylate cyclase/tetratricopeptide (TPR) repeat protein
LRAKEVGVAGETVGATFLFTDLVGSTQLASSMSSSEADALRQTHFGLLRGAIEAAGGREVKNLGDGLMVMFLSQSRSLACAVGMQQAIERHNRHSAIALAVRVGLSTGEVTQEDGDFFGDPVIEAARLCAAAEGGQILATDLLRMTVGRHATQEFVALGALELKGLLAPVPAVQVLWEPRAEGADVSEAEVPLPPRLVGTAAAGLFGFSGRALELARLEAAQKSSAGEARPAAVLIGGEPGMGKSSLAAQAARAAHSSGVEVLFGECKEVTGAPYVPWITALSHHLRHAPASLLGDLAAVHAGSLRRLLPAQAERLPPGEAFATDGDTERFLLMEAVVGLLELASTHTAIMIVLDDLHWADAASLALLRHVISSPAPLRLLLVATYRDSDLSRSHPLTALLADLHREPTVSRIDLGGLGHSDIVELMETAAGYELDDAGVTLAHALRRETDGNPFFVAELLRHLGESGAMARHDDGRYALTTELEELALPPSVRDVVARRVARLGEEAGRVLSLAAVLGRDFDLEVLATIGDVDLDALVDLLEQAATAALVVESADDTSRYRFAHALIQHTLYQDLSAARRQRIHHRAAEVLEASFGSNGDDPSRLAELARHWQAATRPTDSAKAVDYTRRAGDAAMRALAPVDAARWYGQALELADRDPACAMGLRCQLLLRLGAAQLPTNPAEGNATLGRAGALAEHIGDAELLVNWASTRLAGWRTSEPADAERVRLLKRALDLIGDDDRVQRARLLAGIAEEIDPSEWRRRRELSDAALAAADKCGDDATELEVLLSTTFMASADRAHEQPPRAERALTLARASHDPIAVGAALGWHASSCLVVGDIGAARRAADELGDLEERFGLPLLQQQASTTRVGLAMLDGDLPTLEQEAETLLQLGLKGLPSAFATYGGSLFELRWAQGRLAEFAALFSEALTDLPSYAGFRPALATVYYETGQLDDARSLLEREAANDFDSFPYDTVWLPGMLLFAEAAVAVGHERAAAALHQRLVPFGELIAATGPIFYGVADRAVGRLANVLGRPAEAEQRLRHALDVHRKLNSPYWTATTAVDLAEVLLGATPTSDTKADAAALVEEAIRLAVTGGYGAVLRRTDQLRDRSA